MLLRPVDIAEGRLDPDRLRLNEDELGLQSRQCEALLRLGAPAAGLGLVLVGSGLWGTERPGDGSVVAALFTDEGGDHWLHRVAYLTHDPARVAEVDEATQLCRQVAAFLRDTHLPGVTLETNGRGRFLPGLRRREIAAAGLACAVVAKASTRAKDLRIVDAFRRRTGGRPPARPPAAVWNTPFIARDARVASRRADTRRRPGRGFRAACSPIRCSCRAVRTGSNPAMPGPLAPRGRWLRG
jgi:hypothetical protein